jgi:hypothetical protein
MTTVSDFPIRIAPINNITPFTYRDGLSYLEVLEKLRVYINMSLRPEFDAEITRIIEEFNTGIENAENHFTEYKTTTNADIAAFKAATDAAIDVFESGVNAAIASHETAVDTRMDTAEADIATAKTGWQTLFNQFMADVEAELAALNDTAVGGLINNAASTTGIALRKQLPWIDIRDFGAVCNGTVDDTVALQAAINSVAATQGVPAVTIRIPGTVRLTNTVTVHRRAVMFQGEGVGNPSNFSTSPGKGSTIRWDGAAGIPMFKYTDTRHVSFQELILLGNITNRPSAMIDFESITGASVGTNSQIKLRHVVLGGFPWSTPETTSAKTCDYGVIFSGLNANNDQFSFDDVVISKAAIAGLALPNTQSIWGDLKNVFFNECEIGVKTSATLNAFNLSFNACPIDMELNSSAKVNVYGWGSEGSGQLFNITTSGALTVHGALWTIQAAMQGKANIASAAALGDNLHLDSCRVVYQITPKPPLYVRGTFALVPYTVSIQNCIGLTASELDIRGYGVAGKTYVDINSQGLALATTITDKALDTYISGQVKAGPYTVRDGEIAPIICNGASCAVTLPDPTTVVAWQNRITVKNLHATPTPVSSAGTSKTIDGAASVTVAQWATMRFVSDGTQWLSL